MKRNAKLVSAWFVAAMVAAGVTAGVVFGDDVRGKKAAPASVDLSAWPKGSADAARTMIRQYGAPDEVTPTMLVWNDNGPWKRTIVSREEVAHDFPVPHTDMVEQFIDYRVPPDKFDELAAYDGSVIVERTKGELSARCGKEAMNFLALNLAVDIIDGKKDVAEARRFYAETAQRTMTAMKNKQPLPAYTSGLLFEVPDGGTADPDQPFKAKEPAPAKARSETKY